MARESCEVMEACAGETGQKSIWHHSKKGNMRRHGRFVPEQMASEMALPSSHQLGPSSAMWEDDLLFSRLVDVLSRLLFMKRSSQVWFGFFGGVFSFGFFFFFLGRLMWSLDFTHCSEEQCFRCSHSFHSHISGCFGWKAKEAPQLCELASSLDNSKKNIQRVTNHNGIW